MIVATGAGFNPNSPMSDPNVTTSNLTYIDPTHVSFTATVASGATAQSDDWEILCQSDWYYSQYAQISITPCAVPVTPGPLTPASIQPDTWVAGQKTAITITGSGFVVSNSPNYCTETGLSITAGSETVNLTNVNVVSSTKITATVQPQITDPKETATVTVSNYQYNNPGVPLTSSTTAQIVPTTCIVPHVSSVSPNEWFAGNTYRNVAFTGTNFTTSAKATTTCPARPSPS